MKKKIKKLCNKLADNLTFCWLLNFVLFAYSIATINISALVVCVIFNFIYSFGLSLISDVETKKERKESKDGNNNEVH